MRLRTLLAAAGATLCVASIASAQRTDPEHKDLVKLGQSLLPSDNPAPRDAGQSVDSGADAADAGEDAGLDASTSRPSAVEPTRDIADASAAVSSDASADAAPSEKAKGPAFVGIGPAARKARIDSGQNSETKAIGESPIAKLGVPKDAVPVVATTAAVGTLAIWPFLAKTLTGLLKTLLGGLLKTRAKKGQKIDRRQRRIRVFGWDLRIAELGALLLGALIYGFAICYAFQGRSLSASFLVGQEALVVMLYYSRSFVRFAFERRYKLPTQFRFWIGGGFLCLASSYLGTTLGTVGYELEEATTKDEADRIVKMKALLTALALVMALGFFVANILHPTKILQSGRLMMSGMALAEVLPITPMPGKKIFAWNKGVWALLTAVVVPTFVLINYFL